MNRKNLRILIALLILGGCNIIFEDDLSEEIISINMPVDGTVTLDPSQLFWWEILDGAIGYNLQIVKGTFENPSYLVVDTSAASDKIHFDLLPGDYEWRINGWNTYSETDYVYQLLTIEDSTAYEE